VTKYISTAYGSPSGLTDRERQVLIRLAVRSLADNFGETEEIAAGALDVAAGRGMVHIRGDQRHVQVTWTQDSGTTVLVDASRVALRQVAHPTGQLDN
jgi:hypothetical protein